LFGLFKYKNWKEVEKVFWTTYKFFFLNRSYTISISKSECERNFSSINEIITPLRSSLNISAVSAILFVGLLLTEFRPGRTKVDIMEN